MKIRLPITAISPIGVKKMMSILLSKASAHHSTTAQTIKRMSLSVCFGYIIYVDDFP